MSALPRDAARTEAPPQSWRLRRSGLLPGFSFTFGFTLFYLGLIVLFPLAVLLLKAAQLSPSQIWGIVSEPRALAAYRFSFGASLTAALLNALFGLLVAWVLARYRFPGKALCDALVDVPFALPTAVAGIALTSLLAPNGLIGRLFDAVGIQIAFARPGVVIALTFVGLPFVVRTVQPVLLELDPALEEAAAVLGASRLQTFLRVLLPAIFPSLLTGFALAFARALGEYGSIVFISGNLPGKTEIVPLLIVTKLEQYDYAGATAIAAVMLLLSFLLLLAINLLQTRTRAARAVRK
ncbi:MAG: sulfate ABC transporter permease subunit CysT [Myxococcales bacterium]|nr:sulfate ABC transporter permease subunit CysT [Myxococcales bacterium]